MTGVVSVSVNDYPRPMQEFSPAAFKALARSHGLALTDEESDRILPLVLNALRLMQPVRDAIRRDTEPIAPSGAP